MQEELCLHVAYIQDLIVQLQDHQNFIEVEWINMTMKEIVVNKKSIFFTKCPHKLIWDPKAHQFIKEDQDLIRVKNLSILYLKLKLNDKVNLLLNKDLLSKSNEEKYGSFLYTLIFIIFHSLYIFCLIVKHVKYSFKGNYTFESTLPVK